MSRQGIEHLLSDWPAKVLSIAGAIALFFFYQFNRLEERPLSVPLRVEVNNELVPASQYPRTVRLVVRGESNAIFSILEEDLQASIDLGPYRNAGIVRVPVLVEKRGSALGIDPLEISVEPPEIALSIEPRVERDIHVVPSFRGYLEPGYELAGFKLEPSKIEVAGPASLMEEIDDVATEPIELTGRSENFTVRTSLSARNPLLFFLTSDTFVFTAEIRKTLVYRIFKDLSVSFTGLTEGLSVREPEPAGSARVAASSVELDGFVPADGVLEADLSRITQPGVYSVPVIPRFPAVFDVESWSPVVVTVTVERHAVRPGSDGLH
jgi:YbbR domain-containing protein